MGMAYRMNWALEGQSWQPKFGPGPEIWSQRSPGCIPASPLVGCAGPARRWTCEKLAGRLELER